MSSELWVLWIFLSFNSTGDLSVTSKAMSQAAAFRSHKTCTDAEKMIVEGLREEFKDHNKLRIFSKCTPQ